MEKLRYGSLSGDCIAFKADLLALIFANALSFDTTLPAEA